MLDNKFPFLISLFCRQKEVNTDLLLSHYWLTQLFFLGRTSTSWLSSAMFQYFTSTKITTLTILVPHLLNLQWNRVVLKRPIPSLWYHCCANNCAMVSGKNVAGTFILPKGNGKCFMGLQLLQIFHGKLFKDLSKLYKNGLFIWFT